MRRIHPKYILLVSDAAIPLLGYFFWDWNLYFILLFYAFDLLAREVITHLKSKNIAEAQKLNVTQKWQKNGAISTGLVIIVLGGIHAAMWFISPGIEFQNEFIAFWEYEELGIQQGYILLPLVAYAAYAQYKMEFLVPGMAQKMLIDTLWKKHHQALLFMLAGCALALLLALIVSVPELVYVLGIVGGAAIYALRQNK